MSGGGGSTNTVQNADPWSGQQGYLKFGYDQARAAYGNAPEFYPGRTYTPFSQQSEQAMGMTERRAMGSPVEAGMQNYVRQAMAAPGGLDAQNYLNIVMRGNYLNANPYLDQAYNNAAARVTETFNDQVMPGINAAFGHAGGSGSKIHQELATDAAGELSQTLGNMASNIYGGNYQAERGRQMQAADSATNLLGTRAGIQRGAAALAPAAAAMDWQNIDRLRGVGQEVEGMAGRVLQDDMSRWNYAENLPWDQLNKYTANIQGNVGGSTTTEGPGTNPLANAAGAALLPYAASSAIGAMGGTAPAWLSNPWTAAAAAALAYFGSK